LRDAGRAVDVAARDGTISLLFTSDSTGAYAADLVRDASRAV
jgi:hypothetical protein